MCETNLFVVNPVAGGIEKARVIERIHQWGQSLNRKAAIFQTTGNADAEELEQKLEELNPTLVVAVGGDGTLLLCAGRLLHREPSLGLIPLGSANGMAAELAIPENLEQALALLAKSEAQPTDVLDFNDGEDIGLHISDLGLNARLVEHYAEHERRGFLGYAEGLWKEFFRLDPFAVRITADGRKYEKQALMVALANARTYGSGARLTHQGKVDDGQLEICLLHRLGLAELATHIFDLALEESDHLEVIQCREALIETSQPVAFQIDGEVRPATKKVKVKVLPGALKMIRPTKK